MLDKAPPASFGQSSSSGTRDNAVNQSPKIFSHGETDDQTRNHTILTDVQPLQAYVRRSSLWLSDLCRCRFQILPHALRPRIVFAEDYSGNCQGAPKQSNGLRLLIQLP